MLKLLCGVTLLTALSGNSLRAASVLELHGEGVQIYHCQKKDGTFVWTLVAPEAKLVDADGTPAGRHFAGPTWQALDGSEVVGKVAAGGTLQGSGAIPWLVVQAISHSGAGVFDDVRYVIRSHTMGGLPPAAGCSVGHEGSESRVPYSATYTFFGTK